MFLMSLVFLRPRDSKDQIRRRLQRFNRSVQVEETGEDASNYRFGMNISVLKQNFNLTQLIRDLSSFGACINSVADSDNPSFRTLNLVVPKWRFKWSSLALVVLTVSAVFAVAFYHYETDIRQYLEQEVFKVADPQ